MVLFIQVTQWKRCVQAFELKLAARFLLTFWFLNVRALSQKGLSNWLLPFQAGAGWPAALESKQNQRAALVLVSSTYF